MRAGGIQVAAVAIGRNEGARLLACLASLKGRAAPIIYVDSGSTDRTRELAAESGAAVHLAADILPEHGTRTGKGGVSGVKTETQARKFVVDFAGGLLDGMGGEAEVSPVIAVNGGEVVDSALFKVPEAGVWRLSFDVEPAIQGPVELMAHVEGYGQRLSETWLYQWIAP